MYTTREWEFSLFDGEVFLDRLISISPAGKLSPFSSSALDGRVELRGVAEFAADCRPVVSENLVACRFCRVDCPYGS